MTVQRVVTSVGDKTSHYTGNGYQYFYSTDPQKGRHCKLQAPREMMDAFVVGCGRVNTIGKPHLEVLDQGNGWWLVTSDEPKNDGVVSEFIARFNRWVLARVNEKPAPKTLQKRAYTITVQDTSHRPKSSKPQQAPAQPRRSSAEPVEAPLDMLQELAQKINSRYGHVRKSS